MLNDEQIAVVAAEIERLWVENRVELGQHAARQPFSHEPVECRELGHSILSRAADPAGVGTADSAAALDEPVGGNEPVPWIARDAVPARLGREADDHLGHVRDAVGRPHVAHETAVQGFVDGRSGRFRDVDEDDPGIEPKRRSARDQHAALKSRRQAAIDCPRGLEHRCPPHRQVW